MELVIDRGVKSYDVKDADGTLLGVIKINLPTSAFPGASSRHAMPSQNWRSRPSRT